MLWHSILALRLAVLFCRARLPLELPLRTVLQEKNAGEYVLKISQNWLDSNPLTSSALQTESEQWQKLERSFSVETI